MANKCLSTASKEKNDEFYTQLIDIEKELMHYKKHFRDKIIFCNCDDPYESNFFKYFALNFNYLGLKKLICTCYDSSPIAYTQLSIFGDTQKTIPNNNRKAYKIEITEVEDFNNDGAFDLADVEFLLKNKKNSLALLKGDGDFRSEECIELLKQADIVITNPPFSLFREYVALLIAHNKSFVIIGNQNAITYKEVFPYLKNNIFWLGYNAGAQVFEVPNSFERNNTFIENGKKYAKFGNICWFTNLDINKRHETILLYKQYNSNDYQRYDNYDAINVNKVTDIPYDYNGYMGVPITFLDKYNPEQFDIIGLLQSSTDEFAGIPNLRYYGDFKEMRQDMTFTGASGNKANGNPVVKGKSLKGNFLYNEKTGEYVHSLYARILIRRKQNGN